MRKLMVSVFLPAALQSYDLLIPAHMRLSQLTPLISGALSQVSSGQYADNSNSMLCDFESGNILNINMTAWESGMRNGSKLMLV